MDVLDQTFAIVLTHSWRVGLLIVAFFALRRLGRNWIPPRVIFAGWALIAVRMLIPFSVPTDWSPYRVARPVSEAVASTVLAPSAGPVAQRVELAQTAAQAPSRPIPLAASGKRTRLLGILWLAGLAGMLGIRGAASFALNRTIARVRHDDDPRLLALVADEARALGVGARVQVITSPAVNAPAITGLWRPRLLIPAGFAAQLSDEELRFVLRHELGHWRRRDLLALTVWHSALAVHWFNPLAWLAARLARRDCELACDEFVLRVTTSAGARSYGATLLKVLSAVRQPHHSPAALGIFESHQQLRRRIEMIIGYKSSNMRRLLVGAAATALLLALSFTHEARAVDSDASITTEAPKPWFENGSKTDSYVVGVDGTQKHVQPFSAYVKSTAPEIEGFGGMMQSFDAENYLGKRVRFSAWMKTAEVPKGANLWLRVDATSGRSASFDNMADRAIKGTAEWSRCEIVLQVPTDATTINFGFFISGTGQAWVNDAKFEVVPMDTAITGKPARKGPENLAFNPTSQN